MNAQYTYFLILICCIAGPLSLSFDKKVGFYKKWKYAFPAMLLPAIFYIIWDSWFTRIDVWNFNEQYITGIRFFSLPLEEILFFFIVPYCCVFIYECICCYFPRLQSSRSADRILCITAVILFIAGLVYRERLYTVTTFILTASGIVAIFLAGRFFKTFKSKAFLVSYCIILLPFMIINGFLTALPVVVYNNAENLSLRIYTIPFEDIFYGMLLVMMNIALYEKLKNRPR